MMLSSGARDRTVTNSLGTLSSKQSSTCKQNLSSLVAHTFLPRKLPDCLPKDLVLTEEFMLKNTSNAITDIVARGILPELESTRRMFDKWVKLQPKNVEDRSQFIKEFPYIVQNLKIGDTISLYIRKQNGTIMTTRIDEKRHQIMTFRSSLSCETVMSNVGSLVMEFPETNEVVLNGEILASKIFASHLHELSTQVFEIAMPESKKQGIYYVEHREAADPFLLSDWIVGLLLPAVPDLGSINQIKVTKKIRDEVICKASSSAVPFRRSGMWMSVKVALQLQIMSLMGNNNQLAKLVYKIIVLWSLTKICENHEHHDMDESNQMLAKIGRRVKKLDALQLEVVSSLSLKSACLEFVESVVETLSHKLNAIWKEIASPSVNSSWAESLIIPPIRISKNDINNSLQHHVPLLDNFIKAVTEAKSKMTTGREMDVYSNSSVEILKSSNFKRYCTLNDILSAGESSSHKPSHQQRTWLYDTKNVIKKHLDEYSSAEILQTLFTYVKVAHSAYKNGTNPVGFSQMLLCALKSIQVLDKIATDAYPLLLEYKSGIDGTHFGKLLLPHEEDMRFVNELLDYFQNRDEQARFPCILSSRNVSADTFAVRYAEKDQEMQNLRLKILAHTKTKIAEKNAEVNKVRARCEELRQMISLEESCKCEYRLEEEKYGYRRRQVRFRRIKTLTCRRCNLESMLETVKHSVSEYECPLPPTEDLQHAVMFELKIPSKLVELRDALAFLNFEILNLPSFEGSAKNCLQKWIAYIKLTDYQPNPSSATCSVVNLFSSSLPPSKTHHTQIRRPNVLSNDNSKFIINNGMNCVYSNGRIGCSGSNVEQSCTFQINNTRSSDKKMYENLQYAVTKTSHQQNKVIAESHHCHKDMMITEFISFGSVRAGHRIQLRNLYRSISNRTLALDKEATTCLILQTIWQVGPNDKDGNRESHLDFTGNDLFSQDFLNVLNQVVNLNETNYSHPLILLNVVAIAMRIMELNQSCLENGTKLLRKCRKLMDDWVNRIEESITKRPDVVSERVMSLKRTLLKITLCIAFSFNTSSTRILSSVLCSEEDFMHLYLSLTRLHNLTELENLHASHFIATLVQYAYEVALKTQVRMIHSSKHLLHTFACTQWNKAKECSLRNDSWMSVENHPHLFFGEYFDAQNTTHYLAFDFLLGRLLVDGKTQGVLPAGIESHRLYRRFFTHNKLKVQKDLRSYRTVAPFHGKHYEFILYKSGTLRIKELSNDGEVEMLDSALFQDCLDPLFIGNYTHWYSWEDDIIHFRPRHKQDDLSAEFALAKNAASGFWKLQEVKTGIHFVSIKSKEFRIICAALGKIERQEYIHLIVDPRSGILTAKLPRYNLKFNLLGPNLQSVEYPDYKISRNQSMGTLVGLKNGILLDNNNDSPDCLDIFQVSRQMLIVPHGRIGVQKGKLLHQDVEIGLENLQQPPFFSYEFDDELRRLKADKSKAAWLYLAALHAATSSSLPDAFTGMTGTEMAVWILQSALVWSCSPYDSESLTILETIKGFSPRRVYYGKDLNPGSQKAKMQMEITDWPAGLPSLSAFDGFALLVDQLVADSQRLLPLYPGATSNKKTSSFSSTASLLLRAYRRSLTFYNQTVAIKPEYLPTLSQIVTGKVQCPQLRMNLHCDNLLVASEALYNFDIWKSSLTDKKYDLVSYIITSEYLGGSNPFENLHGMSLSQLLELDFRKNWLRLYMYCWSRKKIEVKSLSEKNEEIFAWKTLLANLSYCNSSLVEHIMNLHIIASYAQYFPEPPSLNYDYKNPAENSFIGQEIKDLLSSHSCSFPTWKHYRRKTCFLEHSDSSVWKFVDEKRQCHSYHEEERKAYNVENTQFDMELKNDVNSIFNAVRKDWPCSTVKEERKQLFASPKLMNNDGLLANVNAKLGFWYKNHMLTLFIQNVKQVLDAIISSPSFKLETDTKLKYHEPFGQLKKITSPIHIMPDYTQQIDLKIDLDSFLTPDNLALAKEVFNKGWSGSRFNSGILEMMKSCSGLLARFSDYITSKLQDNTCKKIVFQTGICPRTTPLSLLPYIINNFEQRDKSDLEWVVGALAVLWTHVKRLNRIITLKSKGDAMSVELKRELENTGHQNWSPSEHPEWLLLELELDMMIRPVQVDVARQMIKMPDANNGVMQLNMGEGKTSVIVPMLCSTLTNETTLCRVTVLNSIFKTNFKILTFAIGGVLNRRLYTFPCRRDMDIGKNCLQMINSAYSECLKMKGVVLSRPEHRLSFRLKVYDQIMKGEIDFGLEILKTENWLRKYARDILDESDELLNVKYQLVYTIGTQVPTDGGELRWKTCQKILKIVMDIAEELHEEFGSSIVEYNPIYKGDNPEKFNHFRLLDTACQEKFYNILADRFLQEVKLTSVERKFVKQFLTDNGIDHKVHSSVMSIFEDNPDALSKILLVSGYIRRGILELALSKRWRVEYGVDPKGQRRMAVPFRAKDVAAERTEFGHPDLAIILTHLSYYYSGLSEKELKDCFDCLKTKPGPDMIYSSWLQIFPKDKVPNFLQTYQGVSIRDPTQFSTLFNLLKRHKLVIDFWLSEKILTSESRQFPGKIVMTAWDLIYERNQHSTSGFSGTNDSSILLPLQISQQDLPDLLDTNKKLEETLLQPNNNNHKGFPMGVTCREILEEMKKDGLQVLIDSGAMMLQCDNEQVANLWLEIDTGVEAVVYFSRDNDMLVKCRGKNSQDIPLELSPFRSSLGRCGVFLDDQHSRGTDLKFPTGLKACVTVGTRMRRDKLMQACMRMRKLHNGHSVTFYLSHEAFDKVIKLKDIQKDCKSSSTSHLETQDVINWVCQNTKEFNDDGILYWALAGKNYAQKLAAEDTFHYPQHLTPSYNTASFGSKLGQCATILGSHCVDDEVLLLKDMYGIFTRSDFLINLIHDWFKFMESKLLTKNGGRKLERAVLEKLYVIANGIVQRCTNEVPMKMHIANMLEEEQEKELEKMAEVEEEREIERPKPAEQALASLHPNVVDAILYGREICPKPGIMRLCDVFQGTSFWNEVQPDCWGTEIFATSDFISVITKPNPFFKTDMHLRPLEYLVSREDNSGSFQLLVLSPFEVNELMPLFRKGQTPLKLHMFTMRQFEKQDVLINNGCLQLPLCQPIITIPEGNREMAAMLMASGSLYFNSKSEQKAFARFFALVPQPWTEQQTLAFEHGMITNTGFLLPDLKYRRDNWDHFQVEPFSFEFDPVGLIKNVLRCRHPVVNEVAHVIRLLDDMVYVDIE